MQGYSVQAESTVSTKVCADAKIRTGAVRHSTPQDKGVGKGGRSSNKFGKSHIRKFADVIFLDLRTKPSALTRCGQYFFAICGLIITNLRICGLAHLRNLRICDCGMSPKICGFAICGITKKIACSSLGVGTPVLSACWGQKMSGGEVPWYRSVDRVHQTNSHCIYSFVKCARRQKVYRCDGTRMK